VLPEINRIWAQANIIWNVEQIISEPIVQDRMFQNKIDFVVRTKRDKKGRSDPARQPLLYELMAPENKSSKAELNANLFHIYIFPFIGNTCAWRITNYR
jgi:hypothetical protein